MKIITTLFLIAISISFCYSQDTTYFNSDWKICKKDRASFYRVISQKENLFQVSDFYITTVLQMQGQSSVKDSIFKQGDFYYYNEKGNLIELTTFVDNIKQGKSTQYFENGKPKRITNFTNGDFNGETMYYNSNGILIGKGLAKDNYWYGKWEKYNDDGSFFTNLFYDDKFIFKEIGLKVSTPNHIWVYFDKVENDTLIKYLCRPTNSKSNALFKFSGAPDVNIVMPKNNQKDISNGRSQFDYKYNINDSSLFIKNVEVVEHVPIKDQFYKYVYVDIIAKTISFEIVIGVNEEKFDFYEPIINEFISNISINQN